MGQQSALSSRPTAVQPVALRHLAQIAEAKPPHRDVAITGISMDSRTICPGDLYAAVPGATTHGIEYVAQALERGAAAVWTDAQGRDRLNAELPVIESANIRGTIGAVSAAIYGDPTAALRLVGITGTQGKTTTSYLVEAALREVGARPAVIGTIGTMIDGEPVESKLTTPEAPELQAMFATMLERGVDTCAMEVSSHALVKQRVNAVHFDSAVFLNLGRDHLDFHHDLEDYFAAKARLFTSAFANRAVICIDDEYGARLLHESSIPAQSFSVTGSRADWMAVNIRPKRLGTDTTLIDPAGREFELHVPLVGTFNVANAVAAVAALTQIGFDTETVCAGIARSTGVPGRMQRVPHDRDFLVVVDYAHKPDAVTAVLNALRPVTAGRLIIVLGAGGDRDRGKRVMMGDIAARNADIVVITDDNPRTEDPAVIRGELLRGAERGTAQVMEIGDRGEAITAAIAMARDGDTIVIAGKGHETGQESNGLIAPFDDAEVAARCLGTVI